MNSSAEIITIGDEILSGQTLDTNSHWISVELDQAGIQVQRKTSVGDKKEAILKVLAEAGSRSDIIIITGGLGPTSDDLTKPCLTKYFNTELVRNQEALAHIQHLFKRAEKKLSTFNEQQADLPKNCSPIHNAFGTAPGMWFDVKGKVFISIPGVPFEMKKMMTHQIIPKLKKQFAEGVIFHKTIHTAGIAESGLAQLIKGWEAGLPKDIRLAYLPSTGMVKLRLTSKGARFKDAEKKVMRAMENVLPMIGKYIFGFDNESLEGVLGKLMKDKRMKLAVAESCTGGYISHLITSVPGSSEWFNGSFVAYTNRLKNEQLMVSGETLKQHGAVSSPVVLAMAENVRKAFNAEVGIAVSGIAGPGGGTEQKPVGTVWIGYSDEKKMKAKIFNFSQDRILNIKYSSVAALNMARINLMED